MAIQHVNPADYKSLRDISDALKAAKKIVMVTGAGISTSCGIPDFRSRDGLYSLINAEHNARTKPGRMRTARGHIKGKDLFDANLWKSADSTSVFYTFIASLRRKIREEVKGASATHKFIRRARDQGKLVRCYTQNIDGLEGQERLCQDLTRGRGNRGRFTRSSLQLRDRKDHNRPGEKMDGGCEVVQLHGDLESLRCTICRHQESWGGSQERKFSKGHAPECPNCSQQDLDRRGRGMRGTTVGTLRPNVVLYGEENPASESISALVSHDLRLGPDILIILGTSLKVHGLKSLVKEFAKAVHSKKNGKVIFVNLSPPSESVWKDTIDYWVETECDTWAHDKLNERQVQIPFKINKKKSALEPMAFGKEDKENIQPLKTGSGNRADDIIELSPVKHNQGAPPTPPDSGRRAHGNRASGVDYLTGLARNRDCVETPTKQRFQKICGGIPGTPISGKQPVVLITPRSEVSTPGKRRRGQGDFKIFHDEEDEMRDIQQDLDESLRPGMSSPCARRKRRKLA